MPSSACKNPPPPPSHPPPPPPPPPPPLPTPPPPPRRRDIPVQFLEGLFATLRRAGILNSQRGVKGGYSFARPADQLTVLEVVEALEGRLGGDSMQQGEIWVEAIEALRERLGSVTIAEVSQREARAAGAQMYYI